MILRAPAHVAAYEAAGQDLGGTVDEAERRHQQQRPGAQAQHEQADGELPHALAPGAEGVRGVQRQPGAGDGGRVVACRTIPAIGFAAILVCAEFDAITRMTTILNARACQRQNIPSSRRDTQVSTLSKRRSKHCRRSSVC